MIPSAAPISFDWVYENIQRFLFGPEAKKSEEGKQPTPVKRCGQSVSFVSIEKVSAGGENRTPVSRATISHSTIELLQQLLEEILRFSKQMSTRSSHMILVTVRSRVVLT